MLLDAQNKLVPVLAPDSPLELFDRAFAFARHDPHPAFPLRESSGPAQFGPLIFLCIVKEQGARVTTVEIRLVSTHLPAAD